jgi:cyanophycin synthetase
VVLDRDERGERIVIREGRRTMPIAYTHLLPSTFDGRARMMVQNAMAAAAAAHAAGAHIHDIRQGLRAFNTSVFQAPGRLNLVDLNGVKVVIDYAHNPAGLAAVGDFVERLTASTPTGHDKPGAPSWAAGLRVAVVATPGDRRDEDIRELGRVAATYFDEIIIREDEHVRGRQRGDCAALVLEGVKAAMAQGARAGSVEIVLPEEEAVRVALDRSRPGDLVVLCADHARRVWNELETRRVEAEVQALAPRVEPPPELG